MNVNKFSYRGENSVMKGVQPMQYYNNYYQQTPLQTPKGLKGYPVSSFEEARAAQIDFDGTVFFFPDLINQKIYTKQINLDGTARLNLYELGELPTTPQSVDTSKFITKEDLDAAMTNLLEQLTRPIEKGETASG